MVQMAYLWTQQQNMTDPVKRFSSFSGKNFV